MRHIVPAVAVVFVLGVASMAAAQSSNEEAKLVVAALVRMGCSASARGVDNRVILPIAATPSDPLRDPQRTPCMTAALGLLLGHGDVVMMETGGRSIRSMFTGGRRGARSRGQWECEVRPLSVRCSFEARRQAGPP